MPVVFILSALPLFLFFSFLSLIVIKISLIHSFLAMECPADFAAEILQIFGCEDVEVFCGSLVRSGGCALQTGC